MSGGSGSALSFFETVHSYVERAAGLTSDPRGLLDHIKAGNSVHEFKFPARTSRGYEVTPRGGWSTAGTSFRPRAGSASLRS